MGNRITAGTEYQQIRAQHPTLLRKLACDLEKIPPSDLSCRKVIDVTYQSELFQVFKNTSLAMCDVWNESFAREMANDASKLMDVAYITSDEGRLLLFCMLSCIGFAEIDSKISDVDASEVKNGILKFIYVHPMNVRPSGQSFTEVTVSNLSHSEKREVTARFVGAPTFAENNLPAEQLAAK